MNSDERFTLNLLLLLIHLYKFPHSNIGRSVRGSIAKPVGIEKCELIALLIESSDLRIPAILRRYTKPQGFSLGNEASESNR